MGILRRAERRGKELPEALKTALEIQAGLSVSKNEQESQGGGKGILIQDERTGALSTLNNQSVCYGISAYESNAMKSSNPNSGIYQAETARTLDLNGGSPACNQGGMAVVMTQQAFGLYTDGGGGIEPETERLQGCYGSCYSDTVGALCAADTKGVGNQYVNAGKVIIQRSGPSNTED